jgi:hypothetical protein
MMIHIRIVAPPAEDPSYPGHAYYCRKGFFSINTKIICDSNSKVLIYSVQFVVTEICCSHHLLLFAHSCQMLILVKRRILMLFLQQYRRYLKN